MTSARQIRQSGRQWALNYQISGPQSRLKALSPVHPFRRILLLFSQHSNHASALQTRQTLLVPLCPLNSSRWGILAASPPKFSLITPIFANYSLPFPVVLPALHNSQVRSDKLPVPRPGDDWRASATPRRLPSELDRAQPHAAPGATRQLIHKPRNLYTPTSGDSMRLKLFQWISCGWLVAASLPAQPQEGCNFSSQDIRRLIESIPRVRSAKKTSWPGCYHLQLFLDDHAVVCYGMQIYCTSPQPPRGAKPSDRLGFYCVDRKTLDVFADLGMKLPVVGPSLEKAKKRVRKSCRAAQGRHKGPLLKNQFTPPGGNVLCDID